MSAKQFPYNGEELFFNDNNLPEKYDEFAGNCDDAIACLARDEEVWKLLDTGNVSAVRGSNMGRVLYSMVRASVTRHFLHDQSSFTCHAKGYFMVCNKALHMLIKNAFGPTEVEIPLLQEAEHKENDKIVVAHNMEPFVPKTCCRLDRIRFEWNSVNSSEQSGLYRLYPDKLLNIRVRRHVQYKERGSKGSYVVRHPVAVLPVKEMEKRGLVDSRKKSLRKSFSVTLGVEAHQSDAQARARAYRCAGILEELSLVRPYSYKGYHHRPIEGDTAPTDMFEFLQYLKEKAISSKGKRNDILAP